MPRLGVFRDMHDNDIVPALPDGYVGRRRAGPSEHAHSGTPAQRWVRARLTGASDRRYGVGLSPA